MKVLHIAAWDHGGAGNAAYRLHESLLEQGVDSEFLCYAKKKNDSKVHVIMHSTAGNYTQNQESHYSPEFKAHTYRWRDYSKLPGADSSIELFSDTLTQVRLLDLPIVQEADILNFHWMPGVLNLAELPELSQRKKIIWTLHDMNAFTGGCHYADSCSKYQSQCSQCPQIGQGHVRAEQDLAQNMFDLKSKVFEISPMHVVTPSVWLGDCAKQSKLMSNKSISVIPYSLDANIFTPIERTQAKHALGLNQDTDYILFTAVSTETKRKGFAELIESLELANLSSNKTKLLVMGHFDPNTIQNSPIEVHALGHLSDIQEVANVYNAASVFAIPSLEDNLPNVVLESLACGTPVVGFKIGGVQDMVNHQVNGYLANAIDTQDFANGLNWALSNTQDLRTACRTKVENNYLPQHQSMAYLKIYQEVLSGQPLTKVDNSPNEVTQINSMIQSLTPPPPLASPSDRLPKYKVDGHYFSPIVDPKSIQRYEDKLWANKTSSPGINYNDQGHVNFYEYIAPKYSHLWNYSDSSVNDPHKFYDNNNAFVGLDARSLFTMLHHLKPSKVIEVGSGFSSLLTAEVNNKYFNNQIEFTVIEPYRDDLDFENIPGITQVARALVQDIPVKFFKELQEGDILFIDGSHVSKTGSDVNYMLLEVLPQLNQGVVIHIHDIFIPNEYFKNWVMNQGMNWNEQYLVQAILQYSYAYKVLLSSAYSKAKYPHLVQNVYGQIRMGGSLWIRKEI